MFPVNYPAVSWGLVYILQRVWNKSFEFLWVFIFLMVIKYTCGYCETKCAAVFFLSQKTTKNPPSVLLNHFVPGNITETRRWSLLSTKVVSRQGCTVLGIENYFLFRRISKVPNYSERKCADKRIKIIRNKMFNNFNKKNVSTARLSTRIVESDLFR